MCKKHYEIKRFSGLSFFLNSRTTTRVYTSTKNINYENNNFKYHFREICRTSCQRLLSQEVHESF